MGVQETMTLNRKWYKWPQGYYSTPFVPWYSIVRRLLAAPIQLVGFTFLYVGTVLGYGFGDAESFRRDIF